MSRSPDTAVPVHGAPPAATGSARDRAGLRGLARGGALSLAGAGVSAVAGVLVVLVITRTLPQETAGIFFTLTSVFLIAEMVARLGTGTGLVYAISRAHGLGTAARVPGFLWVALTPVVALSLVLAGALLLAAEPLARLFTDDAVGSTATALRVLAVLLPLTTVSDTLVAATRGHGPILPTVVVDKVGRPVVQLAAVAAVAAGGSVVAVTTAWAAPWVLSALAAGWWLARLQRPHAAPRTGPRVGPGTWREFWVFTGPRAVTSVVQLALQRLDIVLLTLLAGPVPAAVYTAATRFLVVGQFVNQALAGVVEPRLSRLLAVGDRAAGNTVYRTATGWLVLLCWPFYLLVMTYADGLLDWFGAGYDAGVTVVLVLATTMLVATSIGMVDVVLLMGGRSRWNLGNALLALTVNVVVDLLLIPSMGLLGAAIGWAAAICVNNFLPLAQVWRSLRMHPFGAGTGTAVALSLSCFAVLPLLVRLVAGDGLLPAVAATGLGVALYAAGCWRLRRVLALDTLRALRRATPPRTTDAALDGVPPVR
ncbi:oligosaccharide flippase family protein [Blastococcus sp. SYSU DS1024]